MLLEISGTALYLENKAARKEHGIEQSFTQSFYMLQAALR